MMYACVHTCRALFPERTDAHSTCKLVGMLNEGKEWLQLWRSSSARVGADAALMLIMSRHEDIKLETIQSLQEGGIWNTDPALVQIRE